MSLAHWITRPQTVTVWLPEAHVTAASLSCMSSHKSQASAGGKEQCLGTESVSWGGEAQPQKKPLFDPVNGRALEAGDH